MSHDCFQPPGESANIAGVQATQDTVLQLTEYLHQFPLTTKEKV